MESHVSGYCRILTISMATAESNDQDDVGGWCVQFCLFCLKSQAGKLYPFQPLSKATILILRKFRRTIAQKTNHLANSVSGPRWFSQFVSD